MRHSDFLSYLENRRLDSNLEGEEEGGREVPGTGGLVPDCSQFALQVEAPAGRVETVEDLVGDDEAEAALLDVAGQPLPGL